MFLQLLVHAAPVEGVGAMSSEGAPPSPGVGWVLGKERWEQRGGHRRQETTTIRLNQPTLLGQPTRSDLFCTAVHTSVSQTRFHGTPAAFKRFIHGISVMQKQTSKPKHGGGVGFCRQLNLETLSQTE